MTRTTILITVIAVFGMSLPLHAGTDVEEGAAASLAALAITGLVTEATTRSSLEVTVEMFRETEGGNPPFVVNKPSALYRSVRDSSNALLSAAQASHVYSQLGPRMENIKAIADRVQAHTGTLKGIAARGAELDAVIADLERLSGQQLSAYTCWEAYKKTYEQMRETGSFSTADRERLQTQLEELKSKLAFSNFVYSPQSVDYLTTGVQYDYAEEYENKLRERDPNAKTTDIEAKTMATAEYKGFAKAWQEARAATDGLEQVAIMLEAVRDALRAVPTLSEEAATRLSQAGITLSPEALLEFPTRDDIRAALLATNGALIIEAASACKDTLRTLNSGVATSVNTGPLVNEMTQAILAQSKFLDEITDPRNEAKWAPFNEAKTSGRLGNHNAVIYMDNAATPVLKKATFDPSAFIRAHGEMYIRAFKTSAALFGVPGDLPAGTASASNVFTLRAKEMSVDDAETARRTALLNSLLTLTMQMKKVQDTVAGGDQTAVKETKKVIADVAQSLTPVSQ